MMKKVLTPCFECKDRTSICHGQCEKYLDYSKRLNETNEMIKKKRELTQLVNDLNIASYRKGARTFTKKYRKRGY